MNLLDFKIRFVFWNFFLVTFLVISFFISNFYVFCEEINNSCPSGYCGLTKEEVLATEAHNACSSEFPGSHVCSSEEFENTCDAIPSDIGYLGCKSLTGDYVSDEYCTEENDLYGSTYWHNSEIKKYKLQKTTEYDGNIKSNVRNYGRVDDNGHNCFNWSTNESYYDYSYDYQYSSSELRCRKGGSVISNNWISCDKLQRVHCCNNVTEDIKEGDEALVQVVEGISSKNNHTRIAGGTEAEPFAYPWMISLQDEAGNHMCGAVLIDKGWILTARHCLDGKDVYWRIVYHGHDFRKTDEEEVRKIIPHKRIIYKREQDLALIEIDLKNLSEEIKNDLLYSAIDIANEQDKEYAMGLNNDNAKIIGWGCTGSFENHYCKASKVLNELNIKIKNEDFTDDSYIRYERNDENYSGSHHGDSGGPLVINGTNNKLKLIGICNFTSISETTSNDGIINYEVEDYYLVVPAFKDWIFGVVNDTEINIGEVANILDFSQIPELDKAVREAINKPEGDILKYHQDSINIPKLDISNLKLYSNPDNQNTISDLIYLKPEEIYASYNNLNSYFFHLDIENLKIVDLSHNNFANISTIFSFRNTDKAKIKELNLSHNKIVDKHFFGFNNLAIFKENYPELESLDLSYNRISDADAVIENLSNLSNLKYLKIGSNNFSRESYQKLKEAFGDVLQSSDYEAFYQCEEDQRFGDTNRDGEITPMDSLMILELLDPLDVRIVDVTEENKCLDINRDGYLTYIPMQEQCNKANRNMDDVCANFWRYLAGEEN